MSIGFESGRLVVRRPDNSVTFDSAEKLFHGTTFASGTLNLSSYTATITRNGANFTTIDYVDATTDTAVASCPSGCTHIFGFMRSQWSGASNELDPIWRDASGTHVDYFAPIDINLSGAFKLRSLGSFSAMTWLATGGQIVLRERIVLRPTTPKLSGTSTVTRPAVTISYRVLAGYLT